MAQYINKAEVVAEIERRRDLHYKYYVKNGAGSIAECKYDEDKDILSFLNTLEVKEVNIADMADEYYYALREEAANWMDVDTMGHCKLAYYNGCKDVLAKLQKEE